MASTKDDAARRRAERRAWIRSQISELQDEIGQLENCKQELLEAKSALAVAEAEINNGMQAIENVNSSLVEQYPGNRYNTSLLPHVEMALSYKSAIQANITAYKNEINVAINDLNDAISYRESKIRYYQNQL